MKASLQALCGQFIADRDTVKSVFRFESGYIYPVCANLFCSRGTAARAEDLIRSRGLIKANAGVFSPFRGNIRVPLACMLSMSDDPEAMVAAALGHYRTLKGEFHGSDYLALAAILLADRPDISGESSRGRIIYRRMKDEHPFLTSSEDSVFAVLLAFSEKSDGELIDDMEKSYALLKERFRSGDSVQTASHVLALFDGEPEDKAARVISLYDAVTQAGGRYGKRHELAVLAALAMLDTDTRALSADMLEVDEYLSRQKGYGFFGLDRRARMMHAAMIVSNCYAPRDQMDSASLAGTLAIVIAQQIAACAAVAGASAASASASGK